jgi:hypothetical protein
MPAHAAPRDSCLAALGRLAAANLDAAVGEAWDACPCDWTAIDGGVAAGAIARTTFQKCVKRHVAGAVAKRILPPACVSTVTRSARRSTCGLRGAVACCVGHGRCLVMASPGGAGRCLGSGELPAGATCTLPIDCCSFDCRSATHVCGARAAVAPPAATDDGVAQCLLHPGATVGQSISCYDACPPVGMVACTVDHDFDAMMAAAEAKAEASIAAAQGRPYDVTDPKQAGMYLMQMNHELPCFSAGAATHDYGPR